jgi:hypothetical protein
LGESIEVFPSVNNGGSVDFGDALEDSGLEFFPGLNSDMTQEGARHLAE